MLHQLLFALLGKPGSIVLFDEKTKILSVDRSLPIFKSHEVNTLNQILKVGSNYLALTQLINQQTYSSSFLTNSLSTQFSAHLQQSSTYRKCIALSIESYLKEYQNLIIEIENEYLMNNKNFTISNIMAELMKYRLLFPELINILRYVFNSDCKQRFDGTAVYGGAIVDYLHEKYLQANSWIKEVLKMMLDACYKVLVKQINQWILYGQIIDKNGEFFVHRVTWQDAYKKFKPDSMRNTGIKNSNTKTFNMKKIEGKNIEITDWDMYTLQVSMIPKSFIKRVTAGKVLFIGKSTKILKSCDKIPILPQNQVIQNAKKLLNSSFQSNTLEQTIELIRRSTAQKMINLIIGEQNLLRQLEKLNEYYLMTKGDFYQLLLEQSVNLDKIPQKQKAVKKLNQIFLPNTFMRLNSSSSNEDIKKVSFELRPSGFTFDSFRTFHHLCPVGNIDLVDGKTVKFNATDGALWYKSKQNVENDFTMGIIFKFKKNSRFFKTQNYPMNKGDKNVSKAVLSVVLQNIHEVSPNYHSNPHNLRLLEQFLSIDIGFVSNQKQTQFSSFMKIIAVNTKNNGKPYLLGNTQLKKINLNDQNSYHLKISYKQDSRDRNLKVSLLPTGNSLDNNHNNNQLNIDLSIPYYISLEMGRAHVGFISNLMGSDYSVQVQQWKMICTAPNHFDDHWSDICLNYKVTWPLDLILTADIFDNFSRVHKFLFPLRQTQIQLQRIWQRIPRRIKQEKRLLNISLDRSHLQVFERKLSLFRNKLSLTMNQLWKYCQQDIQQSIWHNFSNQIKKTDDFQVLIELVKKYIKAIQAMFFFSIPKLQSIITNVVKIVRSFVKYFETLENEKIDQQKIAQMEQIQAQFDDIFMEFVYTLGQFSNKIGSHHLYHLAERMNACWGRKEAEIYGRNIVS